MRVDDRLAGGAIARRASATALPRSARAALPSAADMPDYEPEPTVASAAAPEDAPRWRAERAWSAEEIFAARAADFPAERAPEPEPEPELEPQRRREPAKRRPDAAALSAARDFEAWFGTGDRDQDHDQDEGDDDDKAAPAAEPRALHRDDPFRDAPTAERFDGDAAVGDRALGAARRSQHRVADDEVDREQSTARRALDNLRRRRAERRAATSNEHGHATAPGDPRFDERMERRAERPLPEERHHARHDPRHDARAGGADHAVFRERVRAERLDEAFDPLRADGVFVDDAFRATRPSASVLDRARNAGLAAARAARMRSETASRALARTSLGRKIAIGVAALALAGAASYAVSPSGGGPDLLASIAPRVDALLTPTSVSGVRPGVVFVDSKYDVVTREEGKALEVWGVVANNGPDVALTPTIEIVSRGENGEALQRWLAIPEKDQLSPGETSRFTARMMNPEGPVFDVDLYIANHR